MTLPQRCSQLRTYLKVVISNCKFSIAFTVLSFTKQSEDKWTPLSHELMKPAAASEELIHSEIYTARTAYNDTRSLNYYCSRHQTSQPEYKDRTLSWATATVELINSLEITHIVFIRAWANRVFIYRFSFMVNAAFIFDMQWFLINIQQK